MSAPIPKAALYYSHGSVWSKAALLAIEEKGYGEDEIDMKLVDIAKGENFAPSFLRLNPKATVPTLVVPLEKTLQADMDVRYKALTDTEPIVEFLDKSRSAMSRTHTTSSAPAPSLAPATIAYSSASKAVIEVLHSLEGDLNTLFYLSARDDAQLKNASAILTPFLTTRRDALAGYLAEGDKDEFHASEKTKLFWKAKLIATEAFLEVYLNAEKATSALDEDAKKKREEYFEQAKKAWEIGVKAVLLAISKEMIGPLVLGDQISLPDLHLGPWLACIALFAGAKASDSGTVIVAKIEQFISPGFSLPKDYQYPEAQRTPTAGVETVPQDASKLAAFWDAIKERPSWQKYYGNGLR